ncbi:GNAT family N-acetyltransferase [Paenibacillus sp. GD4]|uniref:GNAT family N-acetyltransferase n=1 Tax=Paenibacillus sp. GD4 TaxID=3068890 RepID=UPI0027964ED9|nr:GNAT family N-acetyltransferase [Paenibacillus sp. GD4]MDQ1914334.1 GNAT family N-acetyltransferase [Paenibacillus sp. GD4]
MIQIANTSEDVEYIIEAHRRIYTDELQYDFDFVNFIADAISEFLNNRCEGMDNIWLLKIENDPKGSIVIMKYEEDTAQLRWFLIESEYRNMGYGKPMLQRAIQFFSDAGYKKVFLWTNSSLKAARVLYQLVGFEKSKVEQENC